MFNQRNESASATIYELFSYQLATSSRVSLSTLINYRVITPYGSIAPAGYDMNGSLIKAAAEQLAESHVFKVGLSRSQVIYCFAVRVLLTLHAYQYLECE